MFVSACQLNFISSLVHLVFLNSFTVVRIKCSLKASANQTCSHLLESIGSHCNGISTKHVVLFSHYIFMIWLAYKEVEQLRAELQERRLPSQWPQLKTLFQHFNMFYRKLHIFEARKSDTGDEKSGHLSHVCGDKNSWFWQELWMISNHDRGEENWTFLISSQVSRETLPYPGGCFACKPKPEHERSAVTKWRFKTCNNSNTICVFWIFTLKSYTFFNTLNFKPKIRKEEPSLINIGLPCFICINIESTFTCIIIAHECIYTHSAPTWINLHVLAAIECNLISHTHLHIHYGTHLNVAPTCPHTRVPTPKDIHRSIRQRSSSPCGSVLLKSRAVDKERRSWSLWDLTGKKPSKPFVIIRYSLCIGSAASPYSTPHTHSAQATHTTSTHTMIFTLKRKHCSDRQLNSHLVVFQFWIPAISDK